MSQTFFVTYCSFEETPEGRSYIGVHKTKDPYDSYMGSFRDKTFKPTAKIILGFHSTWEEALRREVELHQIFEVDLNPHFANRSRQTSVGFQIHGGTTYSEWMKEVAGTDQHPHRGRKRPPETGERIAAAKRGKSLSEETKEKIRQKMLGDSNVQRGNKGPKHHLAGKPWPEARRRAHELKKSHTSP